MENEKFELIPMHEIDHNYGKKQNVWAKKWIEGKEEEQMQNFEFAPSHGAYLDLNYGFLMVAIVIIISCWRLCKTAPK